MLQPTLTMSLLSWTFLIIMPPLSYPFVSTLLPPCVLICPVITNDLSVLPFFPLRGDKVSMLTHIYPHKPWRNIEVTICKITRLTAHFVWPDVWSADLHLFVKKYGHTWHRMSLLRPDVIKQHKPTNLPFFTPTRLWWAANVTYLKTWRAALCIGSIFVVSGHFMLGRCICFLYQWEH